VVARLQLPRHGSRTGYAWRISSWEETMEKLVLAKVLSVSALVGVGVAAPATAWLVHNPPRLASGDSNQVVSFGGDAKRVASFGGEWKLELPTRAPRTALVMLEPIVIVVPPRTEPAPPGEVDVLRQDGERSCHQQKSETFARGQIRVCDVDRTAVERGIGVFGAIEKPTRIIPRDLPSPSGMFGGP
jgi:hypothetical protein